MKVQQISQSYNAPNFGKYGDYTPKQITSEFVGKSKSGNYVTIKITEEGHNQCLCDKLEANELEMELTFNFRKELSL